MKAAYFLGCNVALRTFEYDAAVRRVAEKLGIELVDSDGLEHSHEFNLNGIKTIVALERIS